MDYSQNTAYMQKLFEHRLSARRNCGLFAKITLFFIAIFNRYFRLPETINTMQTCSFYSSPLGKIILTAHNNALTGLYFDGQKYLPNISAFLENNQLAIFSQTAQWLDIYFQGKNPHFTPPLLITASDFRQSVWHMLMQIPFGKTISYKEIAQKIAHQQNRLTISPQAVGNAVGRNPISLIIPCHRVIGSNGDLTGYAGGMDKKISLLKLEKVNIFNKNC